MASRKIKRTGSKSLIPPDPVMEKQQAFRKAVKRTTTSSTSSDDLDDPLLDDTSSTYSVSRRKKKIETNFGPGDPEELEPVKIGEPDKEPESILGSAFKIAAAIVAFLAAAIGVIYFFTDLYSKMATNTANIGSIDKNIQEIKTDLKFDIDRVEKRLDERINKIESKTDEIKDESRNLKVQFQNPPPHKAK